MGDPSFYSANISDNGNGSGSGSGSGSNDTAGGQGLGQGLGVGNEGRVDEQSVIIGGGGSGSSNHGTEIDYGSSGGGRNIARYITHNTQHTQPPNTTINMHYVTSRMSLFF